MKLRKNAVASVEEPVSNNLTCQQQLSIKRVAAKKTVKQSLKDLALSTEIHGISAVFNPDKHCIERFLWALVILASICVTLHDGVVFFRRYQAEPTQTFTFVYHNKTIAMDKATFCVRLREDAFLININISNPRHVREYLDRLGNFTKDQVLEKLADPDYGDLLVLTSLMIQDITRMEQRTIGALAKEDLEITLQSQKWNVVDVLHIKDTPSSPAVHHFYTSLGIDIATLPRIAGTAICKRLNLTVINSLRALEHRSAVSTKVDLCQPDAVTWYGRIPPEIDAVPVDYVCYHLHDPLNFEALADTLMIRLDYLNVFDASKAFSITSFIGTLDLDARLMPVDLGGNVFQMWNGLSKNYNVELEGEYKMLNLKRRPCRDHGDRLECRSLLRAYGRKQACGCWPLSWFAFYNYTTPDSISGMICGQPEIALTEISDNTTFFHKLRQSWNTNCSSSATVIVADDNNECWDPCQTKIYGSSGSGVFEAPNANISTSDGHSEVIIRMHDFNYPVYQESMVFSDWRSFISSFGGVIGFWLGASILALVSLIMAIVRLVLRVTHTNHISCWTNNDEPKLPLAVIENEAVLQLSKPPSSLNNRNNIDSNTNIIVAAK